MSMSGLSRGPVVAFAATVVLLVVAGCGLGGADDAEAGTEAGSWATGAAATRSPQPSSGAPPAVEATTLRTTPPSSARSRPPSKKPTRKATPTVTATTPPAEDRLWDQAPDCATFEGTAVSRKKAKAALTAAGAKIYWPTAAPQLRLSPRLVKAVAWQESGWQSNIVNCDGGFGLMQVMPDTLAHINQRFGEDYDVRAYRENAAAGANYLAWLTRKFGDNYFGKTYDLSPRRCSSHTDLCLLNMVISGYNAGDGGVEQGHEAGRLPNPAYVDSVRSLMADCPCDRF